MIGVCCLCRAALLGGPEARRRAPPSSSSPARSDAGHAAPLAIKLGAAAVVTAAAAGARFLSRRRLRHRQQKLAVGVGPLASGPWCHPPAPQNERVPANFLLRDRCSTTEPFPTLVKPSISATEDPNSSDYELNLDTPGNSPRQRPARPLSPEDEEEIAAICSSLELDVGMESTAVIENVIETLCGMEGCADLPREQDVPASAPSTFCPDINGALDDLEQRHQQQQPSDMPDDVVVCRKLVVVEHGDYCVSRLIHRETQEELEQLARRQLVSTMQAYARKIILGSSDPASGEGEDFICGETVADEEATKGTDTAPRREVLVDIYQVQ